jgi:30S ribosomal protein S31
MGKGDQRSKRGKLYRGTHGKSRPKSKEGKKKKAAAAKKAPATT